MATNYPNGANGGVDNFSPPTSPESTPLSQGGTDGRSHTAAHKDMGDAITAIQLNASRSNHIHDGTGIQGPKLNAANTHQGVDLTSPDSIHRKIGTGPTDAAAGDHTHPDKVGVSDTSNILGKKTFPANNNAVVIPDFRNSLHKHLDATTGGPAFAAAAWYSGTNGCAANDDVRINLSPGLISIPQDSSIYALQGEVRVNYRIATAGALEPLLFHTAISHGTTIASSLYADTENINTTGFNDYLSYNGKFVVIGGTTGGSGSAPPRAAGQYTVPFLTPVTRPNGTAWPLAGQLKMFIRNQTAKGVTVSWDVRYWIVNRNHLGPVALGMAT